MTGPNRTRLNQNLDEALDNRQAILNNRIRWTNYSVFLQELADDIQEGGDSVEDISPEAGKQMRTVMNETATQLRKRGKDMRRGAKALLHAAEAIHTADVKREKIKDPLEPTTYRPNPNLDDEQNELAEQQHNDGQADLAAAREEEREQHAQTIMDEWETDYDLPIQLMQGIHGGPPWQPPVTDMPVGGGPGGGHTPTSPGTNYPGGPTPPPSTPINPPNPDYPNPSNPNPGSPQLPNPSNPGPGGPIGPVGPSIPTGPSIPSTNVPEQITPGTGGDSGGDCRVD